MVIEDVLVFCSNMHGTSPCCKDIELYKGSITHASCEF